MKRLLTLIFIICSFLSFGQYSEITNGQSGLSVRTSLNSMFSQLYDLHLTASFSSDNASWHDDRQAGDTYFRLSSDLGLTWSDGIFFFDGRNIDTLETNIIILDNDTIQLSGSVDGQILQRIDGKWTNTSTVLFDSLIYNNDNDGYLKLLSEGLVIDSVLVDDDNFYINNDGQVEHLGDLREHIAHSSTPYISLGASITDNGDGTIYIDSCEAFIKISNAIDADFKAVKVNDTTMTIAENSNIVLLVDYNSGNPVYKQIVSSPGYLYSNWDEIPFATIVNNTIRILRNPFIDAATNGIYKNTLSQFNYQPMRYLAGLTTASTGTRQLTVSAGAILRGNDYDPISSINTSTGDTFTRMYVTSGTWTRTTGQTTVSNTQYNNTTTGLATIDNNKYANKWLYYVYDSPSFWVLIEGQNQYTALSDAQAAAPPSTLPPELNPYYAGSLLVAKIIVQQGTTNIIQIQNPLIIQFQTTSSASTDHAALSNLAWSTSGHTGTASYLAGFDGTGAATNVAKIFAADTYGATYAGNIGIGAASIQNSLVKMSTALDDYTLEVYNTDGLYGEALKLQGGGGGTTNSIAKFYNTDPALRFDFRAAGQLYLKNLDVASSDSILYYQSDGEITRGVLNTSGVTFGTTTQIPYMNSGGTDFNYSSSLVWDDFELRLNTTDYGSYSFQNDGNSYLGGITIVNGSLNMSGGNSIIQNVTSGSATTSITHNASSANIGAYSVSTSSATTLSILYLSDGAQGTIFLNVGTVPSSLTINTYSDAGSTGLTERVIGSTATLTTNKTTSITYTCANDGTNTYVYLVYGQQQ